jgi:hypothetical protein
MEVVHDLEELPGSLDDLQDMDDVIMMEQRGENLFVEEDGASVLRACQLTLGDEADSYW